MELRRWLNRGYDIYKTLAVKKAHMDSLSNVISNYSPRETTTDSIANSSETAFLRWSELKKETDELCYKLRIIDHNTNEAIKKLSKEQLYTVLYLRYIRRMSWKEIPDIMEYSKQSVFRIHSEAINELERINAYKDWENERFEKVESK